MKTINTNQQKNGQGEKVTVDPKISVIIPVYNTAQYLDECIKSVCDQTIRNIEIICVDDYSKDNSSEKLQQYKNNDSRVKVFQHSFNKGCAAARNTGMRHSTGKYLYFIDSDDWIDPGYLEELLSLAERYRLPLVYNSRIMREKPDGASSLFEPRNYGSTIGFGTTGLVPCHENIGNFAYSNCCCLYSRQYLEKLRVFFPEGLDYTDNFFHIATFLPQKEIYITNKNAYHYRIHDDSICARGRNAEQGSDIIEVYEIILDYYLHKQYITTCKLNFYELRQHLPLLKDKDSGYKRIQSLIARCIDIIHKYSHLYTKEEIYFFDLICTCPTYSIFHEQITNYQKQVAHIQKEIHTKKRLNSLRERVLQDIKGHHG